jgi:hypothetical protein
MKVVLKVSVPVDECQRFTHRLPEGAEIIGVDIDPNNWKRLSMWFITEPGKQSDTDRHFGVSATGEPVPDEASYVGTLVAEETFVFHVWELV